MSEAKEDTAVADDAGVEKSAVSDGLFVKVVGFVGTPEAERGHCQLVEVLRPCLAVLLSVDLCLKSASGEGLELVVQRVDMVFEGAGDKNPPVVERK